MALLKLSQQQLRDALDLAICVLQPRLSSQVSALLQFLLICRRALLVGGSPVDSHRVPVVGERSDDEAAFPEKYALCASNDSVGVPINITGGAVERETGRWRLQQPMLAGSQKEDTGRWSKKGGNMRDHSFLRAMRQARMSLGTFLANPT